MENQYDSTTRMIARYQSLVAPICEYVGIMLGVTEAVHRDPVAIITGGIIYAGVKGISEWVENRLDFNRFKTLKDKLD